ncbi:hypothetical protein D9Q98_000025 [Chlorella vulgaris]|uniref:Uncharacterized protein n=1 Tax=Chlorella vulgaris TaxID=3077 RepID=A0A9D4Z1F8_CHLVU|nr:hypothetical protein D9Q98_000025 [Chlorella vulgaris]
MHQEVYGIYAADKQVSDTGSGGVRCCSSRCAASRSPGGSLAGLTCDPLIELVYRSGLLSIRDLRAVVSCTRSPTIHAVARERATHHISTAACTLRSMRAAFQLCEARVRGLALDAEARLLQLGVPMNAVHPELGSPLRQGGGSHHANYAALVSLGQALRAATHPACWAPAPANLWDVVAASAGFCMRPQLVLLLSILLPVEARLCYLGLRHTAYSGPGVHDLGGLIKSVLLRMMMHPVGPHSTLRLTKQLKQVAPRLSPFSLWLLRQCAAVPGSGALSLAQQQARRVQQQAALAAQIDRLFGAQQEQVLYSSAAWTALLQGLPTRHLVAFYVKYLADSFQ